MSNIFSITHRILCFFAVNIVFLATFWGLPAETANYSSSEVSQFNQAFEQAQGQYEAGLDQGKQAFEQAQEQFKSGMEQFNQGLQQAQEQYK